MNVKEAPIVEDCPSCGRPMSIRLQHVGQPIRCGHCGCDCVVQIDRASVVAQAVGQRYFASAENQGAVNNSTARTQYA